MQLLTITYSDTTRDIQQDYEEMREAGTTYSEFKEILHAWRLKKMNVTKRKILKQGHNMLYVKGSVQPREDTLAVCMEE